MVPEIFERRTKMDKATSQLSSCKTSLGTGHNLAGGWGGWKQWGGHIFFSQQKGGGS